MVRGRLGEDRIMATISRYVTTEYNRRERILSLVKDAFGSARYSRWTHARLVEKLGEIRSEERPDWARMRGPDRMYIQGYIDACFAAHWHLVGFYYVTGRGPVEAKKLTSDELHLADTLPRGHAYQPDGDKPLTWFHGPDLG